MSKTRSRTPKTNTTKKETKTQNLKKKCGDAQLSTFPRADTLKAANTTPPQQIQRRCASQRVCVREYECE
jgi:hypothetical protein